MQPDEEVTKKILYWVEKLGLDQVKLSMVYLTDNQSCMHFVSALQSTWDEPKGKRK